MRITIKIFSVLLLLSTGAAFAQNARQMSRSSIVPTRPCDRSQYSTSTPQTAQLIDGIAQRILTANPQVFRGDLSAGNICHGVQIEGVRAFANSQTRSFAIEGGLVRRAQNEAQLAWVVSHELAHITMRHGMDGVPIPAGQDRNNNNLDDAAEVRGLMAQHATLSRQIDDISKTSKGSPDANARIAAAGVLTSRTNALLRLHMSPEQVANWMENEADEVAVRLYTQAGYDPAEIGWRQEQEAIARHDGLDPHSPPQQPDAASRTLAARAACGFTGDLRQIPEPERGQNSYPLPCWSIWNFARQSRLPASPQIRDTGAGNRSALERAQNEIRDQQIPAYSVAPGADDDAPTATK